MLTTRQNARSYRLLAIAQNTVGLILVFVSTFAGSCGHCYDQTFHFSGTVKDSSGNPVTAAARFCAKITRPKWNPSATRRDFYCYDSFDKAPPGCTQCEWRYNVPSCGTGFFCDCPGDWVDQPPVEECEPIDIKNGSFSFEVHADADVGMIDAKEESRATVRYEFFLRFKGGDAPIDQETIWSTNPEGCIEVNEPPISVTVPSGVASSTMTAP